MQIQPLLDLPLETLVVFAAGYTGYRIAYTGRSRAHKSIDTLFLSSVFGFIAKLGGTIAEGFTENDVVNACLSVTLSVLVAVIWRKWGADMSTQVLRYFKISYTHVHTNTIETICSSNEIPMIQLVVRKKGGERLMSHPLSRFSCKPFGPCLFGHDGSVGLYVTDYKKCIIDEWEEINPERNVDTIDLTYIPADLVEEIEVTFKSSQTH